MDRDDRTRMPLEEPAMGRRVAPPMAVGALIALGLLALAFIFWPDGHETSPTGPAYRAPATTPVVPSEPPANPPK